MLLHGLLVYMQQTDFELCELTLLVLMEILLQALLFYMNLYIFILYANLTLVQIFRFHLVSAQ